MTEEEVLEDIEEIRQGTFEKPDNMSDREKLIRFLEEFNGLGRRIKEHDPNLNMTHHRKKKKDYKDVFGHAKANETPIERAERLANGYKVIDDRKGLNNNITAEWIAEHIFTQSCLKCGESDWHKLGCDRINNKLGHLTNNVVCACRNCNIKRSTKRFETFYGFPTTNTIDTPKPA